MKTTVLVCAAALGAMGVQASASDYELLVGSQRNDRVIRFDGATGALIDTFIPDGAGGLSDTDGIALSPAGELLVGKGGNPPTRVFRFDARTGDPLGNFTANGLNITRGITVGPDGNIYVANDGDAVYRFDGRTYEFLDVFATSPALGRAEYPLWGPDGLLYVSNRNAGTVLRFDGSKGTYVDTFITGINVAFGMTFGPDGNLYVAAHSSHNVRRYNGRTGQFIDIFAQGGVSTMAHIAFGPDRNLYAASYDNNRVIRYDGRSGALIDVFAQGGELDGPVYMIFRQADDFVLLDGAMDGLYGAPLALQDTQTGFGNSDLGIVDFADGSELDAAYARVVNDNLYLLITGNLASNFDKLEIFIDSTFGGQNRLRGDNPIVDSNGLNRMGDDGSGNGLTFDEDFAADYWISLGGGDIGGGNYRLFAYYATLPADGGGAGRWLGATPAWSDGTLEGGVNPDGIRVSIDNRGRAGVTAGTGVASGFGAIHGVELALPLSAIGGGIGTMRVCAFVNRAGHDSVSNQVLGGIGGGANLGEPRTVDLASIDGPQYFTVEGLPPSCPGDVNGDGDTDQSDLGLLLVTYGKCEGDLDFIAGADFDGSGCVDQADLGVLLADFGCTVQ